MDMPPAWLRHVERALRVDVAQACAMVADTVALLVDEGRRVFLDAEHFFDGYAFDADCALRVLEAKKPDQSVFANMTVCLYLNKGVDVWHELGYTPPLKEPKVIGDSRRPRSAQAAWAAGSSFPK